MKKDMTIKEAETMTLLEMYKEQREEGEGEFMTAALDEAIRRLEIGAKESAVEDFVVDVEMAWRKRRR